MDMRQHIRTLGVCLIAVLALCAMTAAGASAKSTLPEWGGCIASPTHEGLYGNSNCTDPVKPLFGKPAGEYEWYGAEAGNPLWEGEVVNYSFEGGSIGPTTFETTTHKSIECSEGTLDHLQNGGSPKAVDEIWVTFEGCESDEKPCTERNYSNDPGEITDENEWSDGEGFKGELVYLSGKGTANPKVGLTLTAYRKPGEETPRHEIANGALFTVICEGPLGTVEIGGAGGKKEEKSKGNAVVSLIEPVDQMVGEGEPTGEFTQTLTQTAGVQEPAPEKGKLKTLQMFIGNENKWIQMGWASTWTLPPERGKPPVEIKAIK